MKNKIVVLVAIFLLAFVVFDGYLVYRFVFKAKVPNPISPNIKKQPALNALNFPIPITEPNVTSAGVLYTIEGSVKEVLNLVKPSIGYQIELMTPTGKPWFKTFYIDQSTPVSYLISKRQVYAKDIKVGDLLTIKYFWDLKDGGTKEGKVREVIIQK